MFENIPDSEGVKSPNGTLMSTIKDHNLALGKRPSNFFSTKIG